MKAVKSAQGRAGLTALACKAAVTQRGAAQWGEIRKKRKNDFKGLKYTLDPCDHCRVEIFEIRSFQGGENPI